MHFVKQLENFQGRGWGIPNTTPAVVLIVSQAVF